MCVSDAAAWAADRAYGDARLAIASHSTLQNSNNHLGAVQHGELRSRQFILFSNKTIYFLAENSIIPTKYTRLWKFPQPGVIILSGDFNEKYKSLLYSAG